VTFADGDREIARVLSALARYAAEEADGANETGKLPGLDSNQPANRHLFSLEVAPG